MPKSGYHHGDLRTALIGAALKLLEEHGPDGVTMRAAAREAGVSAAAPYRHFADRDELMSAVAAACNQRLMAHMSAAAGELDSPLKQYRAHGVALVTFAVANPRLFQVMNDATWSASETSPEMAAVNEAMYAQTATLVAAAQEAGELSAASPAVQMLAAQAMVYGLARLFIDGQMAAYGLSDDRAEELANAVVDVLGMGLVAR